MALHPELGYFDEGLDLTDPAIYDGSIAKEGIANILPPVAYRSRIFSELEDEKVWTRKWCCVGNKNQLSEEGDLLPYTLGNHGIHVQLNKGQLSGRFNFAQHGGCRFVPAQCQTGKKTKCSYTSCGYSRDRDILKISDVDKDTPTLRHFVGDMPERMLPIRVETWAGRVFVNVDQNSNTLVEQLSGLDESANIKLDSFIDLSGFWMPLDGNWKVLMPAIIEAIGNELSLVHHWEELSAKKYNKSEAPEYLVLNGSRSERPFTLIWIFPNTLIEFSEKFSTTIIVQPTGLDEALIRVRFLQDPSARLIDREFDIYNALWRDRLEEANTISIKNHRVYEAWGTPHSPGTSNEILPKGPSGPGYIFQQYIINKLLTDYEYVWNAPLYSNARR